MSDLVQRALNFATEAHKGQFRFDGSTPYVEHCKRVMSNVQSALMERDRSDSNTWSSDNDEDILAASLLHDTLEDTSTTNEQLVAEFGENVARMVRDVTSSNEEIARLGSEQLNLYTQDKLDEMETRAIVDRLLTQVCLIAIL